MNFLKNICLSLIKTSITIKTFKLLPIVTTFLMAFFCMNAFSTEDGTCEKAISNENTEETKNIEETTTELHKDNNIPTLTNRVYVKTEPVDQNAPNTQYDINLASKNVEETTQNDESIITQKPILYFYTSFASVAGWNFLNSLSTPDTLTEFLPVVFFAGVGGGLLGKKIADEIKINSLKEKLNKVSKENDENLFFQTLQLAKKPMLYFAGTSFGLVVLDTLSTVYPNTLTEFLPGILLGVAGGSLLGKMIVQEKEIKNLKQELNEVSK